MSLENLKSEKISIDGNEKIEQKYKLKVIYDYSNQSNSKSIVGEVQIKIYSEQKRD